jgi:hypothetical protein
MSVEVPSILEAIPTIKSMAEMVIKAYHPYELRPKKFGAATSPAAPAIGMQMTAVGACESFLAFP